MKVTRLDGEGGFTQSEIEGCNIIKTSIEAIYIKSNAINYSQPGGYEVVFEVADTHGNLASASCTATVKAKPTTSTPGGDESADDSKPNDDQPTEQPSDTNYIAIGLGVGIGLAALIIIAATAAVVLKRHK